MQPLALPQLIAMVTECGDYARSQRNALEITRKSDGSIVTQVDQFVEQRLVGFLRETYPDYAILGEEGTQYAFPAGDLPAYSWVIDPIDGTSAYAGNLTGWCVGVGLLARGVPIAGVVYSPLNDEVYVATPEGHAYRNNTLLTTVNSANKLLDDWMSIPSDTHRKYDITYPGRVRTTGATILSLCYTAANMASAALVGSCKAWDIAPALALLRYTGCELWDLHGNIVDIADILAPDRSSPTMLCAPKAEYDRYRQYITIR
jgi:myo-inositol-1(or 4)-monophosphatase